MKFKMKDLHYILGLTLTLITISNAQSETIELCNDNCMNGKQLNLVKGENSFIFNGTYDMISKECASANTYFRMCN